jgi:hypothetical protein
MLFTSGCARFRIDELAPAPVYTIPIQVEVAEDQVPEGLAALRSERIYGNFPYMPAVNDDGIFLPDSAFRVIRYFTGNQEQPVWILNASGAPIGTEIETTNLPDGIPGNVTATDDALYVELHILTEEEKRTYSPIDSDPNLPAENRLPGILRPEFSTEAPSRIARVDLEDRTVRILLNTEGENARFTGLARMVQDGDDTIYAMHFREGIPAISVYESGAYVRTVQPGQIPVPEDRARHRMEIESLLPYPDGNTYLLSVVFRNPATFAPEDRRIYVQAGNSSPREIYVSEEEGDALSWPARDGGFIMETLDDSGGILYKIFSQNGEYLNNQLLRFPGVRESWRETYRTLDNRIFSVRIDEGNYQLNEWR